MYFNVVIEQLLTTIKEYNLKRTIVYVSNQTKAEQLKKIGETALNSNYNNVQMRCVISEQSHIVKIDNIEWFKNTVDYIGSKILISVNIFDEGIDIPMCDSVLFAEARHSETQIVQNIGRALRLHHTKQIAYVIIPVYFEEINNDEHRPKIHIKENILVQLMNELKKIIIIVPNQIKNILNKKNITTMIIAQIFKVYQ